MRECQRLSVRSGRIECDAGGICGKPSAATVVLLLIVLVGIVPQRNAVEKVARKAQVCAVGLAELVIEAGSVGGNHDEGRVALPRCCRY